MAGISGMMQRLVPTPKMPNISASADPNTSALAAAQRQAAATAAEKDATMYGREGTVSAGRSLGGDFGTSMLTKKSSAANTLGL